VIARVLFAVLMLMGAPPVVTTGTPAFLSVANAASMSLTVRMIVAAPGS
jgi:hypothetical protein